MMTLQGLRLQTEYMMEQIKIQAIDEVYGKWKAAVRKYYEHGYDAGETTKLYKELENLGLNMEVLFEEDIRIRDEICGI